MGFHVNDSLVRGDLFRSGGKWAYTVAIDMTGYWRGSEYLIHDAVEKAYWGTDSTVKGVIDSCGPGLTLVVLEPCHENSHPVVVKLKERP